MAQSVTIAKQARKSSLFDKWSRVILFALVGIGVFRWLEQGSSGPKENSIATPFALRVVGPSKTTVSLDTFRGQPAVIEVFAHWCGACRSMAPNMAELARAERTNPARFLGVAIDTSESEALALHQTWGIPFDVALGDSAFSANYRITSLPTIIVLDAEGRVRNVTTGVTSVSRIDRWLAEVGAKRL